MLKLILFWRAQNANFASQGNNLLLNKPMTTGFLFKILQQYHDFSFTTLFCMNNKLKSYSLVLSSFVVEKSCFQISSRFCFKVSVSELAYL